jgi:hypothetical protein
MILGACVDAGLPLDTLREELAKLGVEGFTLGAGKVKQSGIAATHITVDTEEQHAHRHLRHIVEIIDGSTLSETVKANAKRIFTRLAEAEAVVHDTTPEKIHFHEVGALDAIVDIVGACICFEYFGVEKVAATPIHVGGGTVKCAHGVMPVPVPAVVELTKGVPVIHTAYDGEITTPTGAAILTTLTDSWGKLGDLNIEHAGYGAGSRTPEDRPNVLRIVIGELKPSAHHEHSVLIETNIDDMNPEYFGYITEQLLENGARDVYMAPIYMKKGRPGTLLSVITDDNFIDTACEIIFRETSTLGVRISRVERRVLDRAQIEVETEWGTVRVKAARFDGADRLTPEYEECVRIAKQENIPLRDVYERIIEHAKKGDA